MFILIQKRNKSILEVWLDCNSDMHNFLILYWNADFSLSSLFYEKFKMFQYFLLHSLLWKYPLFITCMHYYEIRQNSFWYYKGEWLMIKKVLLLPETNKTHHIEILQFPITVSIVFIRIKDHPYTYHIVKLSENK